MPDDIEEILKLPREVFPEALTEILQKLWEKQLDIEEQLRLSNEYLKTIALRTEEVPEYIYITYPKDGGTSTITAGITSIDFFEGVAIKPDGTIEELSDALRETRWSVMQSLFLETDEDINYRLDKAGWKTLDADDKLLVTNQRFRLLEVEATVDTKIAVWACTNPTAILRVLGKASLTLASEVAILAERENVTVNAGSSVYIPATGSAGISKYKLKTISLKGDYAFNYVIQVSDDGTTFDDYFSSTLTANVLETQSFEESYRYCRLKITNPDTANHTLNYGRIKGQ